MSFLAIIDNDLNIIDVIWSDPVYLIMKSYENLKSIIRKEEIALLVEELKKNEDAVHFLKDEYHFIDYDTPQSIFFKRKNSKILIFGCSRLDESNPEPLRIIKRFMMVFKENCESDKFSTIESVRYNFEKIQALNSKLVVAERQLEKQNSKLKEMNQLLNNRLVKDALTGLVSKYQYRDEIDKLTKENPDRLGIFMFIDIDDFKRINDTYGHGVGDEYLIEFANRLKSLPIENTIKLRVAGDEFGLFTYGLSEINEEYLQNYWKILKDNILVKPFEVRGEELFFAFSGGTAIYGRDTNEIYELIEFADSAMYKAKRSGKNKMASYQKDDKGDDN